MNARPLVTTSGNNSTAEDLFDIPGMLRLHSFERAACECSLDLIVGSTTEAPTPK